MVFSVPARVFSPVPVGLSVAPMAACAWVNPLVMAHLSSVYTLAAERARVLVRDLWRRQLEPGLN